MARCCNRFDFVQFGGDNCVLRGALKLLSSHLCMTREKQTYEQRSGRGQIRLLKAVWDREASSALSSFINAVHMLCLNQEFKCET